KEFSNGYKICENLAKVAGGSKKIKCFTEYDSSLDTDPCIICLGILQNSKLTTFVDKIVEEINTENYDCDTISLTLTIPTVIIIRERAVFIYLSKIDALNKNVCYNKAKVQNIKDVWKWYLSFYIQLLTKKSMESSNIVSPLTVDVFISYPQDQEECQELLNNYTKLLTKESFMKRKEEKYITKKNIETITNSITDEQFEQCFTIPPKKPGHFINIDKLVCKHSSIFIGGRYTKFSRRLCQTPWFVHGKWKMENSVQDLICKCILDFTKSKSTKFLSSGREDVDVRMLFHGRPFVIELIDPRITKINKDDLLYLKQKINENTKKIRMMSDLKIVAKKDLKQLKEGEYSKSKTYRALCICKKVVNSSCLLKKLRNIKNLKIIQNTPIRVLHRRALFPRERIIFELRARFAFFEEIKNYQKDVKYISDDYSFIILDFKAQAGTYVKEFVHGDFGRTVPNLCYLLDTEIDIIALDVTNISLEWP
ncbi:PREDICTED: putative tRNA pseudouridine synthase Pus10, partial [Ceratosolen solmsi marchali]|uniref:tRNA pseudouridine(55) synthase n=1 Tax=Ceratosolen solmsi marchali TaxID=326594 RepID=A0AAJ6YWQ4_9HYME